MKLSDVCKFQNGYAFKSSLFSSNGKYRVIKIKELKDGEVRFFADTAYIDDYTEERLSPYLVNKGDVLFALTGDPVNKNNPLSWVGRVSRYNHKEPALLNQRVCKVVVDEGKLDSNYLYYYFRVFDNFYSLAQKATGSANQANISTSTIGNVLIDLPPLQEQQMVAGILCALDDKIANNTKINRRLEQMAQAIFKSWFVDFEPFDGEMPYNWEIRSLIGIANYLNGLAMQKFRPAEGEAGLPVLKIKELRQGTCDLQTEFCSPNIRSDYIIHDGDVVFSWSGSLLVDIWCGGDCGLNQHLFKVTSNKYSKWFYHSWTCHHLAHFIAMAADKATTMGHIKRDALENAEVIIPDDDTYRQLDDLLNPIYEQIINNKVENRKLTRLRDAILPRLMSGELLI